MRASTLFAVSTLERVAGAQLHVAGADLAALQSQRAQLVERSSGAKRRLLACKTWSAFACAALVNHVAKSAALSAHNLARQRAILTRGARLSRIKLRWAAARAGLTRRYARAGNAPRWRD